MPQPFTKYSLICSSRGSLAHNHAGWQLLHGSSAHQKAQICRCDSKSVDAFQSYSSLKTDNFFLFWYVIWFSIQNLGGPPWFQCLLSSRTDFLKNCFLLTFTRMLRNSLYIFENFPSVTNSERVTNSELVELGCSLQDLQRTLENKQHFCGSMLCRNTGPRGCQT